MPDKLFAVYILSEKLKLYNDINKEISFKIEEIIMKTPHLVQYQGSKRMIAPEIIKFFSEKNKCDNFCVNDINEPLLNMVASFGANTD